MFTIMLCITTLSIAQHKINLTMKESAKKEHYPEKRFAIIMANEAYNAATLPVITGAKERMDVLKDSLLNLGYDVLACPDLKVMDMRTISNCIPHFADGYEVMLAYYIGHCMKDAEGEMILMPIDACAPDSMEAKRRVSVKMLAESMAKSSCHDLTLVLDGDDRTTTTPAPLKGTYGHTMSVAKGDTTTTVHMAFAMTDNFLGKYSENLYDKHIQKEAEEERATMDAINALATSIEAEEAAKRVESPQDKLARLMAAANRGDNEAMYQLALHYEDKDKMESMIWMGRASSAGNKKAKEYIAARKQAPKTKVRFYPKK